MFVLRGLIVPRLTRYREEDDRADMSPIGPAEAVQVLSRQPLVLHGVEAVDQGASENEYGNRDCEADDHQQENDVDFERSLDKADKMDENEK